MQKRGQFTLFVILGILVVSSTILVYYFRDEIFASEWERESAKALTVPDEAQELHDQVSGCVEDVAIEALNILGQQGGYITMPEDPIAQSDVNPFSNSLEIFPGSDFKTVYWFYEAANGVQKSQIPTKDYMALELENYMNENLANCANSFELLTEYNASVKEVSTEVEILDDEVLFTVSYPVKIALDDFVFDFENFYVSEEVPLGRMYDTANEIMEDENENYKLEELTYDSIVLYDEVPSSWSGFDCTEETWDVERVENALKTILVNNVLAVKVRGTDYSISNEADKNYFEWNMIGSSNDYNVNMFASESWPFYMEVSPTENGDLKSDMTSVLGGLLCLSNYNFIYDVKYPVLISLYDSESDYLFQFATQVVLDNNQPRENELGIELEVYDDEICSNSVTPLTIYVDEVDEDGNLRSLEGAKVSFKCISSLCSLGESNNGVLNEVVPECVNAQISAEKDGYVSDTDVITTLEEGSVDLVLEKLYNLTYDIKVVDFEGNVRELNEDEVVSITLTEQDGYTTTVYYPSESGNVLLIPGVYKVQGQAVGESAFNINIDPTSFTKCSSYPEISLGGLFGLGNSDCYDVTTEDMNIEMALFGGVENTWNLNREELIYASHITFYVTSPGEPEDEEQLEEVYSYVDTGIGFKEPELS